MRELEFPDLAQSVQTTTATSTTRRVREEKQNVERKNKDKTRRGGGGETNGHANKQNSTKHRRGRRHDVSSDWVGLLHVSTDVRRLLIGARRAMSPPTTRRGRGQRGTCSTTSTAPPPPRPSWAQDACLAMTRRQGDVTCDELIPPVTSGMSPDAHCDWSTLVDMYRKIQLDRDVDHRRGGLSIDPSNEAARDEEERKVAHVTQWIRGTLTSMRAVDLAVLRSYVDAVCEGLSSRRASDTVEVKKRTETDLPPGFTPDKAEDATKTTAPKRKKGRKKKKTTGRKLVLGQRR